VNLLLDTSALLGVFHSSFPLGARARTEIVNPQNDIWVSPVSAYEIEWKRRNGKLQMPAIQNWQAALASQNYQIAALDLAHFLTAAALPMHHRDPWDRLMIAQALAEGMTIVSADAKFPAYGVATLW